MVRIVTALSGLVLVVLALRLAMVPLFPLSKFVAPTIAAFEAETGSAVKIREADLELLPTPSVVAHDVGIELPEGFGEVRVDRLVLALKPMSFLSGTAELDSVTAERPVLRLSLKGEDLDPAKTLEVLTSLAERATDRHFQATDGRLSLETKGGTVSLDGVTTSAASTGDGDRLSFQARFGETPLLLTVESGSTGVSRAKLSTQALNVALDGGLAGGAFAGQVDLSVPDAAALGGAFAGLSGGLHLNGAITLSPERAEIVDVAAEALNGHGRLSAAFDLSTPRASLDLHADFGVMSADTLLALGKVASHLGFDPIRNTAPLDGGVDLKLAELTFPGGGIKKAGLTAVYRDGRFGMVFDGMAGDGKLSGRVDLVPEDDGRKLAASFGATDLGMGDAAALGNLSFPVSGHLSGDVRLSAHGRSAEELMATLAVDGSAQLRDGSLSSLPLTSGVALPPLGGLSADLSIMGLDKPARLIGQATSSSGGVNIVAEAVPRQMMDGGSVPVSIQLDGPTLSAGFDGGVNPFALSANGSLTLTSHQLPRLAGLSNLPANASLDGQIEASSGGLTLSDARLLLGEAAFGGLLDLSSVGETSQLTGRLSGDIVDIPALAGALSELWSGASQEMAKAIETDLHLEVSRIMAGPVAIAGGPLDIRVNGKSAEVAIPKLSLGGGAGSATLNVKADDSPSFALSGKLAGARFASLAPLLGGALDGELHLAANVRADGKTRSELLRSATGVVDFGVSNGVIDGLDPVALVGRLAHSIQVGLGADSRRVAFENLAGHLDVQSGVATSKDLVFAAGDLQVSGSGKLGLVDNAIDLRLVPKLSGYPAFEAPIAVTGALGRPRLYPDLPGLLDDPAAGYARLASMTGGFARLIQGNSPPKLEAVKPDALTSIIDNLSDRAEATEPPVAVIEPPKATTITPLPLPAARPPKASTTVPRARIASQTAGIIAGPLDLGALGRKSGAVPSTSAAPNACRPGRDGRCIP